MRKGTRQVVKRLGNNSYIYKLDNNYYEHIKYYDDYCATNRKLILKDGKFYDEETMLNKRSWNI